MTMILTKKITIIINLQKQSTKLSYKTKAKTNKKESLTTTNKKKTKIKMTT